MWVVILLPVFKSIDATCTFMYSCSSETILALYIKDCSKKTAVCKIISTNFISHKKTSQKSSQMFIYISLLGMRLTAIPRTVIQSRVSLIYTGWRDGAFDKFASRIEYKTF